MKHLTGVLKACKKYTSKFVLFILHSLIEVAFISYCKREKNKGRLTETYLFILTLQTSNCIDEKKIQHIYQDDG